MMSMSSDENEDHVDSGIPILDFRLKDGVFITTNPNVKEIYENGYFGRWINETTLSLAAEELLLLLDRKKILIQDPETKENLSSADIVNYFASDTNDLWSRYLVYKDLRNRGYVVSMGTQVTAPFRIYSRGGKPGESVSKFVVFPLPEGEDIDLDFLDQIVKQANLDRKKLLLSVIDRLGDVTYYQVSQLNLERNELEYEYHQDFDAQNEKNGES